MIDVLIPANIDQVKQDRYQLASSTYEPCLSFMGVSL